MVDKITALTRSGLKDFLVQRVTAIILACYTLMMLMLFVDHPHLNYAGWLHFHQITFVRIFTLIAILSIMLHAWVGIWTILTDYIHVVAIRSVLMVCFILGFLYCFLWSIQILWS